MWWSNVSLSLIEGRRWRRCSRARGRSFLRGPPRRRRHRPRALARSALGGYQSGCQFAHAAAPQQPIAQDGSVLITSVKALSASSYQKGMQDRDGAVELFCCADKLQETTQIRPRLFSIRHSVGISFLSRGSHHPKRYRSRQYCSKSRYACGLPIRDMVGRFVTRWPENAILNALPTAISCKVW